jgi:Na+-transporting NADH:ubiquinone oxidoreductase subunit C
MSNDSTGKTILVAFLLCVVCSLIVSAAAVSLKPIQERNKVLEKKKNILKVAGLYKKGVDIEKVFNSNITIKFVDFKTGQYTTVKNPIKFDQKKAAKDPKKNYIIPRKQDLAGIKKRSQIGQVFLVKKNSRIETLILPMHGKGLWSTMYGFIALKGDLNTVKGFSFYEHGETPGLGGEVDNPNWKKLWAGKKLKLANGTLLKVIKGKAKAGSLSQIDGLSGATITTNGVDKLVRFWLGKEGYAPYLKSIRHLGGQNG